MIDHDDYAYDTEPASGAWRKTLYKVLLSVGVIGGFAAAVVFAYSSQESRDAAQKVAQPNASTSATTAPLIAADRTPVKVRPKDPGGVKVPNRNSEIYRRLNASKRNRASADRKQPRRGDRPQFSEDSLAPGAGDAVQKKKDNDGDVDARPRLRSKAARLRPAGDRRVAARGPTCEAQQPASGRSMLAELNQAGVKLNKIAPGAGVQTSRRGRSVRRGRSAAEMIGPYRIQLGAYRSAVSAQRNWDTLVKKNKDLLGRLNMVIERVHLGPRGVVYRLQAGPLGTERAARTLCRSLGRRRIGCILVAS